MNWRCVAVRNAARAMAEEDRVRLLLSAMGTEDHLFDESHINTLLTISGSDHLSRVAR